jgi:hypothetical protein
MLAQPRLDLGYADAPVTAGWVRSDFFPPARSSSTAIRAALAPVASGSDLRSGLNLAARRRTPARPHSAGEAAMTDERFADDDLKRNENPERIAGAVGGASGAGVGAGAGVVFGPLGVVIGALAGAAGGWWASRELHGALTDADRSDDAFRRTHEHAGAARSYDELRHGYHVGYLAGRNPDHDGSEFEAIEPELRSAWVKAHEQDEQPVSWDEVRPAARSGFDVARNR